MIRLILVLLFAVYGAHTRKVDVRFYGEALCPYCAGLTTGVLSEVFEQGIAQLTDFRYIGWGNVAEVGDKYACQHGPLECTMNTVLNCGQELSSSQEQFFRFLYCVESQAGPGVQAQIPGCAKSAELPLEELEKCYRGSQGQQLDELARNATNSLKPAHTYVPWVTVNGVPLFEQTDLLATCICVAFNGSRPEACYKAPEALLGGVSLNIRRS